QLKNFQIKGRRKAHGFIVPRQMGSVSVRLRVHSVHREGKNGNKNQKILIKRGKARLFDLEKVANIKI
ncbi:MAG: hypothetical protein IJ039_10050, partial [Clostridia bacterium]|nr:hypothetical protein [Clostridia bacterium]